MRIETKQIYYADDGTMFDDEVSCKKHEDSIRAREKHTTYWIVNSSPDLCEGRGYQEVTYIEAYIPADYPTASIWLEDWCFRTFGRKLSFVQGVMPMPAWILHSVNRERYLRKEDGSIGSTRIKAKSIKLIVGDKEHGLLKAHGSE